MPIDLSRLGAQSFERLIRALCYSQFGPAGLVYSSGADGARDFCFDGEINGYPWTGYLVVQAKFKEKLQSPAQDLAWLKKSITNEKKKYAARGIRRPTYYIIATNVALSGADGIKKAKGETKGGYTKISEHLSSWKSDLGVKEIDIWPANKLEDLLESHEAVRRSFSAWLTPGDVISSLMEKLYFEKTDFLDGIRKALRNCLRRDQFARLKDAGDVSDPQIRASQVFVDLPLSSSDLDDFLNGGPKRVVSELIERAREKLDPESLNTTPDKNSSASERKIKNKIVILGGPGQGKSTASVFSVQVLRASIISDWAAIQSDIQMRGLAKEILGRAENQKISTSPPRRFPVFVSLPRFADAISFARGSNSSIPSLLGQIASDLSLESDEKIEKGDLRQWLKNYPWMVMLDGLDEVPPSGERAAILEAISVFEGEIISLSADLMLVVTTRPQGYNDDLSSDVWDHWALADLTPSDAVAYGEALGSARYPDDPHRRNEILRALQDATKKSAISRLMTSPLQVTIMHMIVDTGGSIPNARWTLFSEYFEILKKREKAKGGENQKILERNWSILGPIHQRAGLVLQTDSELAGAAHSYLTKERFTALIQEYLSEEGHSQSEISERSAELVEVALHRLVLLAARDEGQITFDVRSLQEFMAAGALTAGPDSVVTKRLSHIAAISHWRHVFLIAASRCFSDDVLHHLRQTIVSIPRQIEIDGANKLARSGGRLALDLFIDGIGADHPISRRMLAAHALDLLSNGAPVFDRRFISLAETGTHEIIISTIKSQIATSTLPSSTAAWGLLLSLASSNPAVYSDPVKELFPSDSETILKLLDVLPIPFPESISRNFLIKAIAESDPTKKGFGIASFATRLHDFLNEENSGKLSDAARREYKQLSTLISPWRNDVKQDEYLFKFQEKNTELKFVARSSNLYAGWLANASDIPVLGKSWAPVSWAARFAHQPSAATLASSLREVFHGFGLENTKKILGIIPWPLSAFIASIEDDDDLPNFAADVEVGLYGDSSDWINASERWATQGVSDADIAYSTKSSPFDPQISVIGAPIFGFGLRISHSDSDDARIVHRLMEITVAAEPKPIQHRMAHIVAFSTVGFQPLGLRPTNDLLLLLTLIKENSTNIFSNFLLGMHASTWESEQHSALLGEISTQVYSFPYRALHTDPKSIIKSFIERPKNRGLIIPIALSLVFSEIDFRSLRDEIPMEIFTSAPGDCEKIVGAILATRMYFKLECDDLLKEIASKKIGTDFAIEFLAQLFKGENYSSNLCSCIFSLLENAQHPFTKNQLALYTILGKTLDARLSDLCNPLIWREELDLPKGTFAILQTKQ
ncbi:NACHT domain-containing protein [Variovorax sp. VaC1]|uniref:NACHT domain-containing protein n=1 Tax=Variovorax sp. VaC1 TaxID=3373132 RepID=UPI003748B376